MLREACARRGGSGTREGQSKRTHRGLAREHERQHALHRLGRAVDGELVGKHEEADGLDHVRGSAGREELGREAEAGGAASEQTGRQSRKPRVGWCSKTSLHIKPVDY